MNISQKCYNQSRSLLLIIHVSRFRYPSTNVQRALSEVVSLRHPVYAYPVADLDTLTSIDKYRDDPGGKLRDCVMLKPGTNTELLYTVMLHYPVKLCAGDFIRAEVRIGVI